MPARPRRPRPRLLQPGLPHGAAASAADAYHHACAPVAALPSAAASRAATQGSSRAPLACASLSSGTHARASAAAGPSQPRGSPAPAPRPAALGGAWRQAATHSGARAARRTLVDHADGRQPAGERHVEVHLAAAAGRRAAPRHLERQAVLQAGQLAHQRQRRRAPHVHAGVRAVIGHAAQRDRQRLRAAPCTSGGCPRQGAHADVRGRGELFRRHVRRCCPAARADHQHALWTPACCNKASSASGLEAHRSPPSCQTGRGRRGPPGSSRCRAPCRSRAPGRRRR